VGREDGATLCAAAHERPETDSTKAFSCSPPFSIVTPDMRIAREEIFGPVLGIIRVKSFEEAMQVANDTEFGLSSSIFTNDVGPCFASSKKSRPA
jgi:NAD-dependent aldehyde dehydrogenases